MAFVVRADFHCDGSSRVKVNSRSPTSSRLSVTARHFSRHLRRKASASLDAGAAWSHLALQAHAMGLSCRGIAGFDAHKVRQTLHVPARYKSEMAVAIGRMGRKNDLPEKLRNCETPSRRRPLHESAFAGGFPEQQPAETGDR